MIDVVIPSNTNIRKKEHEKLEKYQWLNEELVKMWKVKAPVVPLVIRVLSDITQTEEVAPADSEERRLRFLARRVQS